MDINSLIANYLSTGSYDSSEISDIAARIKNIADSLNYDAIDSIFDYGNDGASEEEFLSFFEGHCEDVDDSDQLAEDVSLLFNILNSDNSDSVLDSNELQLFQRTSGSNKGSVTEFSFWNKLLSVNAEDIESELDDIITSSNSSTTSADDTESLDGTQAYSDDSRVKYDEDTGEYYVKAESWTGYDSSKNSCLYYIIGNSYDFDAIKEAMGDDYDYETVREQLLNAIVSENNISNPNLIYNNQKIILPDAFEALGIESSDIQNSTSSSSDSTTSADSTDEYTTLSDDDIQEIAEQIVNGEASLDDYYGVISPDQYIELRDAVSELKEEATEESEETVEPEEDTGTSNVDEYSDNIEEIALDKEKIAEMLNDDDLSLAEKFNLLSAAKNVDGNVIEDYLKEDDSLYINTLKEFSDSDSEYTAEDIVDFQKEYFEIQGDNKIDSENWDDCLEEWVAVFEKFEGDSESIETLNGGFSVEGLASKIQAKFDEEEAQALLERLEDATGYTIISTEPEEDTDT